MNMKAAICAAAAIAACSTANAQAFDSKALAMSTVISTMKNAGIDLSGVCKLEKEDRSLLEFNSGTIAVEIKKYGRQYRVLDADKNRTNSICLEGVNHDPLWQ